MALPAFDREIEPEANEIAGRSNVLRGHFPRLMHEERFENIEPSREDDVRAAWISRTCRIDAKSWRKRGEEVAEEAEELAEDAAELAARLKKDAGLE